MLGSVSHTHVSVHSRTQLSDLKKLVYLKFALKSGSAKHVVEGLPAQEMTVVKQLLTVCKRDMIGHDKYTKCMFEPFWMPLP